jgi:hypothetical protein
VAVAVSFNHSHQPGSLSGDASQFRDVVSVSVQVHFRPGQVFVQGIPSGLVLMLVNEVILAIVLKLVSGFRCQAAPLNPLS